MNAEKAAEEQFKYLISTRQKASENMNSLLRTFFISLIAFGFAPSLAQKMPEIMVQYRFYFGLAVAIGIAGLLLEWVQNFYAMKGATEQWSKIVDYVCETKNQKKEVDHDEIFGIGTNYAIYNKQLFVLRQIFGIVGGFSIGYPLLSWLWFAK